MQAPSTRIRIYPRPHVAVCESFLVSTRKRKNDLKTMTSPTEHALQSKTCARSLAYPEPESSWLCSWASQTYQQCSHGQKSVTAWPPRTRIDVELGLRLQTSRKITTRKTVHFQLTFFFNNCSCVTTETRACLFAMF